MKRVIWDNLGPKNKEEAMRPNRYLFCLILAGSLLATPAMAQDVPPMECDTDFGNGNWTVKVTEGTPCAVLCSQPSTGPFCNPLGACTGIEYEIVKGQTPDHVATLFRGEGVVFAGGQGSQAYPYCEGDPLTGLGYLSCHERAVKVNPYPTTEKFRLVLDGSRELISTSVVVKKGGKIGSCEILGLGKETVEDSLYACVPNCGGIDPNQTLVKEEILRFKGCEVSFLYDTATGDLISAELTENPSNSNCDFYEGEISELELVQPGVRSFGLGVFGDGIFSTGTNSCSCRVIGGRWWCWGAPCPSFQ